MSIKKINNINYFVNNDEFNIIHHNEYTNLKIIDKLGYFETIVSFINKISHEHNLFFYNVTHGGFIPLNCSKYCNHTFIQCNNLHFNNIDNNCKNLNLSSNITICEHFKEDNELNNFILYDESLNFNNKLLEIYNFNVIISKINVDNSLNYFKYNWINTNLFIYINYKYNTYFCELFKYFLSDDKMTLHYDNLNHLCIMVKNAGPQFEQMLTDNINYFDKWTILDTGSSDETIDIINRILVGKKYGNLYCEPFINFKDSRNRLLELAGKECKYITMLDDTYVINGDLREFLKEVRGDQYSNSFTLYISSNDSLYGSNRIICSDSDLKYIYRIHEVITDKNNINIIIPQNKVKIVDRRFDYMEKRTMERKQLDLKLLFEELEDNPNDPRTYYYLAQTYNLLEDYEKAYEYFLKRLEIINAGFIQERYDSAFEAGRIANFKLNKLWDECLKLYEKAIQIDDSRPDAYYFIGIHYYLENNYQQAYKYFKKGFELGFPIHCQYSLKPTLSYYFLPKFLTRVCYQKEIKDYLLGEQASQFFLLNNKNDAEDYQEILSWYQIYKKLNIYQGPKIPKISQKPILCFVADGGFNQWSGSNILTTGVGGSETYIIEMAHHIQKQGIFSVYVFCNCNCDEIFEDVHYIHLDNYAEFIYNNYVINIIVSRYSEYLPLTFDGFSENVYLVVHDLTPSGIVIPIDKKLKNIFCLTEWHCNYMSQIFPQLKHLLVPFYYGVNPKFMIKNQDIINKVPYSFIYSSFPNRGLLPLLQMWPSIYQIQPLASLHIYSDINGSWVNNVAKEQMDEIKILLEEYSKYTNSLNIFYHGWVQKSVLSEAWKKSDIWFYPCIFMETFCLTALEAAASKTLCITSDLAALQNTVADRGIIIQGNPVTAEWKEQALEQIKLILNGDEKRKFKYIQKNFEWSMNVTWENQANKLSNSFLMKSFEYNFDNILEKIINIPLCNKNDYHIIKIGAFTGNVCNDIIYHNVTNDTKIIFIEPVPLFFTILKNNYNNKYVNNNFIFIDKALSNFNGKMKMYYPSSTNDFNNLPWRINQLGSKNIDHIKKHGFDIDLDCINVNTITFNSLINEYDIDNIFILYIDTEGCDYDIITSIDFIMIKPKFLIFENMHLTDTKEKGYKYDELIKYLNYNNYIKIDENESDTLMMLNNGYFI
jgi:FkbM family methyltransferase